MPCEIEICPDTLTFVDSCRCGATNFQKDQSEMHYCCGDEQVSRTLSPKPCQASLEKAELMEKIFCPSATLSKRKSGLIVTYQLTPTVTVNVHRTLVPFLEKVKSKFDFSEYRLEQSQTAGFKARVARETELLSPHAFGIAVDLNWKKNPFCPLFPSVGTCGSCKSGLETDLPARLVEAFETTGFEWGGRWAVPDPMHFELRKEHWPAEPCNLESQSVRPKAIYSLSSSAFLLFFGELAYGTALTLGIKVRSV